MAHVTDSFYDYHQENTDEGNLKSLLPPLSFLLLDCDDDDSFDCFSEFPNLIFSKFQNPPAPAKMRLWQKSRMKQRHQAHNQNKSTTLARSVCSARTVENTSFDTSTVSITVSIAEGLFLWLSRPTRLVRTYLEYQCDTKRFLARVMWHAKAQDHVWLWALCDHWCKSL